MRCDGSASRAPSANRSRWMLDDHLAISSSCGDDRAGQAEPGVQLVDLAVRRHARVRLRHARAVEEARSRPSRRSWCRFSRRNYRTFSGLRAARSTGRHGFNGFGPGRRLRACADRQRFRRRLLDWYRRHGRDLPWRETRDPYHILVSEVMLQQTQVDRVLPKYDEWLAKYPTLARWPPRRKRRRRHVAAARLQHPAAPAARHRARVGRALRRRAAVGRGDAPVVQGHRRLHGRGGPELRVRPARGDPRHQRRARPLSRLRRPRRSEGARDEAAPVGVSRTVLPLRHVFDFNQALMDFGATSVYRAQAECLICPMRSGCRAFPFNPDNEG